MKSRCFLALLLVCSWSCTRADAGNPWWGCRNRPRCPTCPNDYISKPLPIPCPTRGCGPNDYCSRPLPHLCPVKCFGPDDYCSKPLPHVAPCYPPWYTCGPPCKQCH